jgi:hypothetical protein
MSTEQNESRPAQRPRSAGQAAHGSASSVAAKTQEAAEEVKHIAHERVEQIRKSADSLKTQAAERVRKFASAVRWVGESLRHEDEAFVARYADTASDSIDQLATYLDSANPEDLVHDAHDFALKRPTWFFGGALLIGLGAGRFLKSSGSGVSAAGNSRGRAPARPESPGAKASRTSESSTRTSRDGGANA